MTEPYDTDTPPPAAVHDPDEGATMGDPGDTVDAAEDDPSARLDPHPHPGGE